MFSFRQFLEDQTHKPPKKDKENYLDGMHRELGIDPNSIPEFIESGPIEIDNLYFNQTVWQVLKPIDLNDKFVRIKFHKSLSPSLNQHCYRRRDDGKMEPAQEDLTNRIFLIPLSKLSEMLSKGWQAAAAQGGGGGPI
jgi:hypothetical protein